MVEHLRQLLVFELLNDVSHEEQYSWEFLFLLECLLQVVVMELERVHHTLQKHDVCYRQRFLMAFIKIEFWEIIVQTNLIPFSGRDLDPDSESAIRLL